MTRLDEIRKAELKKLNDRIAALEAVAEAAKRARLELIRPLRDGETIFECCYRAKEILRTALDAQKGAE